MNQNSFEIRSLNAKPSFNANRLLRWLVVLALLVAVGGVGFFIFNRSSFSPNKVDFKIKAPEETSSGQKITYTLNYRNNNPKAIKDLQLTFFYPPDAMDLRQGRLSTLQTENVKLGDLGPGEEKNTEFSAYLIGNRGDIKKSRAVLSFYGTDVPAVFKKEVTIATNISSLAVALTLVSAPRAVSGQEVTYLLDYRNESPDDLSDLRLVFTYPDGFTPSRFSPAGFSKNMMELKKLKSGEGDRLSVSGLLQGKEGDNKTVAVVLQRKIEDTYIDFEKSSASTVFSTPPLTLQILANEKSDYNAQLGDDLEYQIKFTNNTDADLFGLTVSAKLEGSMFDLGSVRSEGFFNNSTRLIAWNASVSPLLNHLAPHQEGAVSFRTKIKSGFPSGGTGIKDSIVKVSAEAGTPTIPPGFDLARLSAASELVTKIVSLPTLTQKISRNDSTFGSSGPVPPRSGQKTVYTISWEIINIPNDILKARVVGILPPGVEWESKSRISGQQPAITFNAGSRQVIWPLETVPAGTGGQFPKYQGWFMISFKPSANNVGQVVKLIKDAFLEGQDGFTHQDILVRVNDVTSNDLVDFPGQGSVVE